VLQIFLVNPLSMRSDILFPNGRRCSFAFERKTPLYRSAPKMESVRFVCLKPFLYGESSQYDTPSLISGLHFTFFTCRTSISMKSYNKLVLTLIALFGAALSLQATYVGTSVGYMIDAEEEIISARVGWTVKETGDITHNLELEVAYSSTSEYGISLDITPVMLNYIIKSTQESGLTLYAGAGIGYTFWDLSYMNMPLGEELTLQGLVGLEYGISETTSFRAGYRYVHLDDIEDSDISLNDSVIELGLVFSF
jgi:hypothetical protein